MTLSGRYELAQLLGAGSFGTVWRAIDHLLGRTVAIKILHRNDDDARRRFQREAVVLHRQLSNEFVVGLLDHAGLAEPTPYIVLEFCELKSLRSWVGTQRTWRDIATALLHAAKGLGGLHVANGFHRDIKPENLLVARVADGTGWRVKLADFGLARVPHSGTGTMTRNGGGTKGYIAPEIRAGRPFHASADIYSLGIVGVEMLVGRIDVKALGAVNAPGRLTGLLRSMVSGLPGSRPTIQGVITSIESLLASPREVNRSLVLHNARNVPSAKAALVEGGGSLSDGAKAIGVGALVLLGLSWLTNNASTYYDPVVDRKRGPNGRFRSG